MRRVPGRPARLRPPLIARLRERLGRPGRLTDVYYLLHELWWLARDRPERLREALDRDLSSGVDPWGYASSDGQARLADLGALLDRIPGPSLGDGLEIGCAEGHFTEQLAPRCRALLAVDLSSIALSRARDRCAWGPAVRFARWDLRWDSPPGVFDLVVATDVLETLGQPRAIRAARRTLIATTRPGGYLLVGSSRQSPYFERAWWGKTLLTGGKWIDRFVGEHPELELVASVTGSFYVNSLLRRRA